MYNYHSNIIWKIDLALLGMALVITAAIIISALINSLARKKRKKALLSIKRDVFELLLSGQATGKNVCLPLTAESTPRQFLDIQSNRDRESVFFNEAEQKFFKECFVSKERISGLENIAKKSLNKWRRIEAIMCLGYTGNESALKIFPRLLDSRDEDILYFSMLALGQIRTVQSAGILLSFLKKNILYRHKIVSLLENFPPQISGDVMRLMEEKDPSIRFWALKLYSKFKDSPGLSKIEKLTRDDSIEVRAAACECLGSMNDKTVKATLQKCLEDSEWLVRSSAIKALSQLLGDESIPFVIYRINDGSLTVIDAVKKAISAHPEPAIPYILKIFETKNEFAKRSCLEALENSGNDLALRTAEKLKVGTI